MPLLALGGIKVHSKHSRSRKALLHRLLYLLGSHLKTSDILRTARGTYLFVRLRISAIMAYKPPVVVCRECDITMRTFYHMSALSAINKSNISPPVEKQLYLLTLGKSVLYKTFKASAEYLLVTVFEFFP